ncbi:tyrosine-type recombinase/integrase [Sinorhizobium meliloti]|nr:tyrosine-type recombinase/integrase [Sinorhizobium meliloti]
MRQIAKYIFIRKSIYYYRRSVPHVLRRKFGKREVIVSLKTADYNEALSATYKLNSIFECTSQDNSNLPSDLNLKAVKQIAVKLGFPYEAIDLSPELPSKSDIDRLLARLSALDHIDKPNIGETLAIAGILQTSLKLSQVAERYIELTEDEWFTLSSREQSKRHNPLKLALRYAVDAISDKDLRDVTKQDALSFKAHLLALIKAGKLEPTSARKQLLHVRKSFRAVIEADFPDLKNQFDGVKLGVKIPGKSSPSHTQEEVKEMVGAIAKLPINGELKAIMMIASHTGCGPKELCLLTAEDIRLEHAIPHIFVGPNAYRHKVKSGGARHREIPLLGEALEWAKRFPDGFPRYRRDNGGEAASAAANKALRGVSGSNMYRFRHAFKDMLRNAEITPDLQDSLMGHKTPGIGSAYGQGFKLQQKEQALKKALNFLIQQPR